MNKLNSQITNAFVLELDELSLIPSCRNMAVSWLGQMAVSFTVGSLVDDFMFKQNGQAMRDAKRVQLTHVLAFCMDNGYTAQMAHDEIKSSIDKAIESAFRSKSFSQEQMELLIACGEDEDSLIKTLAEDNQSGERIHNARKNKLESFIGDVRGQTEHMLSQARDNISPDLAGIPAWMASLIATKIQMACEMHRKYLIRGIARGQLGNAGQLSILNGILQNERMGWVHNRLDELNRESQFDDKGCNHEDEARHAGDNEQVDITY